MTDQEAYETAFTVNNNRRNLSDDEKGRWFKIMLEKFPEAYPTQEALAKHVGVSQVTISRLISDYEFREALKAKEKGKTAENHHDTRGYHGLSASTRVEVKPSITVS